jgi:hypothetical protein
MNENQTDRVELVRRLVVAELAAVGVHAEPSRTPQGLEVRIGAGVTDRAVRLMRRADRTYGVPISLVAPDGTLALVPGGEDPQRGRYFTSRSMLCGLLAREELLARGVAVAQVIDDEDGGATVEIAPGTDVDPGSAALVDALAVRWGVGLRLTRPDPGAAHRPLSPRA